MATEWKVEDWMVVSLTASLRANLFSLQDTQTLLDRTQLRLATGRRVNSAFDNPSSFFAAQGLNNKAGDLNRLLDAIGQNQQVIKTADRGLTGITRLLEQAEALTKEVLAAGAYTEPTPLSEQILDALPVAYWRLNDTSGSTAVNLGAAGASLNGTYAGVVSLGSEALYDGGDVAASFDGGSGQVNIPDSNQINLTSVDERTIEMVFRADDTGPRQVLWEEGAQVNAMSMYIDNGRVYVNGRDQGDWGPFDISAPITAGEVNHVTLVLDQPNGEMRGYLNGQLMGVGAVTIPLSSHSGDIAIGDVRQRTWFHDGVFNGNSGLNFGGEISDVAVYNTVLSDSEIADHANAVDPQSGDEFAADIAEFISQIDLLAQDASYRGTNLLLGNAMTTYFNETRTSLHTTQGDDFTSAGLGLDDFSIANRDDTQQTLSTIRAAINKVRSYANSLATDLSIIDVRSQHTQDAIDNFLEGSDKLTLADTNEEGARLLSLQTSQQMGISALNLASLAQRSILRLFLNGF